MKPVAWLNKDDSSLSFKNHGGGWQPLYTHPAKTWNETIGGKKAIQVPCPDGIEGCLVAHYKIIEESAKTLTDEDLFKVYADLQENYTGNNFPVDLGRAILREAQDECK